MCNTAIEYLNKEILAADPDILVVIGDDQEELFMDEAKPTFGVFNGTELKDFPVKLEDLHPSLTSCYLGMAYNRRNRYLSNRKWARKSYYRTNDA